MCVGGGESSVSDTPPPHFPPPPLAWNVFPVYLPPLFAISAHAAVSLASRDQATPPAGNTPRLGKAAVSAGSGPGRAQGQPGKAARSLCVPNTNTFHQTFKADPLTLRKV